MALIRKNCPEMTLKIECEDFRGDLSTHDLRKKCASATVDPWLHNLSIADKYDWKHAKIDLGKLMDPEDIP